MSSDHLEAAALDTWAAPLDPALFAASMQFSAAPRVEVGDGGDIVVVDNIELGFGGVTALAGALLMIFFRYTRVGLAFRAVADDQSAALAVGLRLPRIWATV
jgi:branched-subunit amino acid ABC-type transport system permease component